MFFIVLTYSFASPHYISTHLYGTKIHLIVTLYEGPISLYTVRCRYNALNFLTNIHKKHPIARPLGRGMGCILWIQHLINILPRFLWLLIQYLTILDRVITVLDCISYNATTVLALILKFDFYLKLSRSWGYFRQYCMRHRILSLMLQISKYPVINYISHSGLLIKYGYNRKSMKAGMKCKINGYYDNNDDMGTKLCVFKTLQHTIKRHFTLHQHHGHFSWDFVYSLITDDERLLGRHSPLMIIDVFSGSYCALAWFLQSIAISCVTCLAKYICKGHLPCCRHSGMGKQVWDLIAFTAFIRHRLNHGSF